jgi:uncharacterized integral membrane protein (TIGR00698 family)
MLFGIFITLLIAVIAYLLQMLPFAPFTLANNTHPLEPVLLAILIGISVNYFFNIPEKWRDGFKFSQKKVLAFAIILLGSQLDLNLIKSLSWATLFILITSISIAFLITYLFARLLKVEPTNAGLIAIGTAICGSSAIAAAAPNIHAKQHQVSLAITTINLLGLILIFLLPIIGHALKLSNQQFGCWAGISIQAVPQVIAAGISFSPIAGNIATLVKLVRVCFLAPFLIFTKWLSPTPGSATQHNNSWKTFIPPFIIGFFGMILLRSCHLLQNIPIGKHTIQTIHVLSQLAHFCMCMALAGIGLNSNFTHLKKSGLKTLTLATLSALTLMTISLTTLVFW